MEGFTRAMTKSDETAQAGKELTDAKKYWEGRRKAEEMMRVRKGEGRGRGEEGMGMGRRGKEDGDSRKQWLIWRVIYLEHSLLFFFLRGN